MNGRPKNSLYINPQYIENKLITNNIYLTLFITVNLLLLYLKIKSEKSSKMNPWPISPNIIENM